MQITTSDVCLWCNRVLNGHLCYRDNIGPSTASLAAGMRHLFSASDHLDICNVVCKPYEVLKSQPAVD